jgi:hypothetical protein
MRITDVFFRGTPGRAVSSLALRISGNPTDAIPTSPTWRKLRRLWPSQYFPALPASIRIISKSHIQKCQARVRLR